IPNVCAALIEDRGWRYTNFYFGLYTLVVLLPLVLIVVKPVLGEMRPAAAQKMHGVRAIFGKSAFWLADRKSVVQGQSVSYRVALGGRRILKKKKIVYNNE